MNKHALLYTVAALAALPLAASARDPQAAPVFGGARYFIVDAACTNVGELVALDASSTTFSLKVVGKGAIVRRPADPASLAADYSKALTPQDFADIERAAHDAFFDVSHSP